MLSSMCCSLTKHYISGDHLNGGSAVRPIDRNAELVSVWILIIRRREQFLLMASNQSKQGALAISSARHSLNGRRAPKATPLIRWMPLLYSSRAEYFKSLNNVSKFRTLKSFV